MLHSGVIRTRIQHKDLSTLKKAFVIFITIVLTSRSPVCYNTVWVGIFARFYWLFFENSSRWEQSWFARMCSLEATYWCWSGDKKHLFSAPCATISNFPLSVKLPIQLCLLGQSGALWYRPRQSAVNVKIGRGKHHEGWGLEFRRYALPFSLSTRPTQAFASMAFTWAECLLRCNPLPINRQTSSPSTLHTTTCLRVAECRIADSNYQHCMGKGNRYPASCSVVLATPTWDRRSLLCRIR